MADSSGPLLKVDGLCLSYLTRQGEVRAVQDVSFELARGQSLGLVGESGCGKTSVANCMMRLLPDNARLSAGRVLLDGQDLLLMSEEEIRLWRWRRIAMVFQAAMNVLDPVYRVGQQVVEAIEAHGMAATEAEASDRVARLFRMVGLDPRLMERYPHEFSGGMRQRAVIAMALSCEPGRDNRRRADHCLGRDCAGPNSARVEGHSAGTRYVHYLHQPRHRGGGGGDGRGGRDVRRQAGGDGRDRRRVPLSHSSLHGGADVVLSQRQRREAAPVESSWRAARPGGPAAGLSVPSSLPPRHRDVPE